jgi:hypothetical protein
MALPNSFDFADSAGTVLLLMPDAVNDRAVQLDLHGETVVTPISGVRYVSKDGSKPSGVWTFEFFERDRATLQFLKDFYDTQRAAAGALQGDGTSKGFWFPTWQWDLEIVNTDGSFFDLLKRGYADSIFALGDHYRRFVLAYRGAYRAHHVTAASVVSGLDHLTTSLVNSAGSFTATLPWVRATGVRPLWLRYGRFDSDDFAYSHEDGGDAFRVSCTIRELPDEAP